jgi:hypothetical protein
LALDDEAAAVSFTGLLDFAGAVAGEDGSIGALGVASLPACASVVAELASALVSATLCVVGATAALCAGFAAAGCEPTTWSNTTAPPIAIAVMAPNAIPKWFTRFSLRDVIPVGKGNRPHVAGTQAEAASTYTFGSLAPTSGVRRLRHAV